MRRQINDEVETIVLKSLAKERERRYQSAGELGRDVRHYLAGEPIEAKRDSGWYVLSKTLRRYQLPVGVAAVFAVLVAVSAIVMTVLFGQANAAKGAAVEAKDDAVEAWAQERDQRELAEINLKALSDLARAALFEFDESIADLRGGTAAREKVLTQAQRYLQLVADQARGNPDPALLRDLAEAYDRVGDIQGGLFMPDVGKSGKGTENYAVARRMREKLAADSPNDPAMLGDLAESIRKTGLMLHESRRYAEAQAEYESSIQKYDEALRLAPADAELRRRLEDGRAESLSSLGSALSRLGQDAVDVQEAGRLLDLAGEQLQAVERHWRARAAALPDDEDAVRELASAQDGRTLLQVVRGESQREAASELDDQGQLAQAIVAADGAIESFNRSLTLGAEAAAEFGGLAQSRPGSRECRRGLYLATHNMGLAAMQIAFVHQDLATALTRAGRDAAEIARRKAEERRFHEQSLPLYERALAITEGLASSDEANIEAQRELAVCLNKVGNALGNLGRFEEAAKFLDRSLLIRREILLTDPTQRHERDLALGEFGRGRLEPKWVKDAPELADGAAHLRLALEYFERSKEHFESLQRQGVAAEKDWASLTSAVERCRTQLERLATVPK